MARNFEAKTPHFGSMPLSIGLAGPPGGGKTKSALRLAAGMQRVRPGPIILIDTEARRAIKYAKSASNPNGYEFLHVEFEPPYEPKHFLEAIEAQLKHNPAAIIVDSLSDEHEGKGGYLAMHDEDEPKVGGNKWAAWARPSGSRRELVSGFQRIKVPLIFTFRAREKTKQVGKKIFNIGYQPVAPAEIVYALDLMCKLPPNAQGRADWNASTQEESFIIKKPESLLRFLRSGEVLNEDLGEEFARWALGDDAPPRASREDGKRTPEQMVDDYVAAVNRTGRDGDGADDLVNGRDALRNFQLNEKTVAFVEKIKASGRDDLVDRIIEANRRRAEQLSPMIDDDQESEDSNADS
jgi:hypothetical protein